MRCALTCLFVVVGSTVAAITSAFGATLTVGTASDAVAVDGAVSLREALLSLDRGRDLNADVAANRVSTYGSSDEVRFAIGAGVQTIAVAPPLPPLLRAMLVDGTSQPGYTGTPLIVIDGTAAGAQADGLVLGATAAATVQSLTVRRFARDGIQVAALLLADDFETGDSQVWGLPSLASGETATLADVISSENGRHGLLVAGALVASAVAVTANSADGVLVDSAGSVILNDCVVGGNGGRGLLVLRAADSAGLTFQGSAAAVHDNVGDGIALGDLASQTGAVNAWLAGGTVSGNAVGVHVAQRDSAGTPTTSRITSLSIHDNRDSGVRLRTSFQTASGVAGPFRDNLVFHNAMGAGCASEQLAAQIDVVGPVAVTAAVAAACAGALSVDQCATARVAGNSCYWQPGLSVCVPAWDLSGGVGQTCGLDANPNRIYDYNTTDSSIESVGLMATNGAVIGALNNQWRTSSVGQNLEADGTSWVDASTLCSTIPTCSSP